MSVFGRETFERFGAAPLVAGGLFAGVTPLIATGLPATLRLGNNDVPLFVAMGLAGAAGSLTGHILDTVLEKFGFFDAFPASVTNVAKLATTSAIAGGIAVMVINQSGNSFRVASTGGATLFGMAALSHLAGDQLSQMLFGPAI